jgi:hypothetical protein
MSAFADAMGAIRSIILIEERVKSQGASLEKLASLTVDLDRRLVRVETMIEMALHREASSTTRAIPRDV